jgi:hypothetical protein
VPELFWLRRGRLAQSYNPHRAGSEAWNVARAVDADAPGPPTAGHRPPVTIAAHNGRGLHVLLVGEPDHFEASYSSVGQRQHRVYRALTTCHIHGRARQPKTRSAMRQAAISLSSGPASRSEADIDDRTVGAWRRASQQPPAAAWHGLVAGGNAVQAERILQDPHRVVQAIATAADRPAARAALQTEFDITEAEADMVLDQQFSLLIQDRLNNL